MKTFTVVAAFHMCEEQATLTVEADDYADACAKAQALIGNGDVDTDTKTYDAGPTYVHGVVEGDGNPWDGISNVPRHMTEEGLVSAPFVAALRNAIGAIYALQEQVGQMRGMFDDEDGTIEEAMENADDTVEEIQALLKGNATSPDTKSEIIVEVEGGLVQSVYGTGNLIGVTYSVVDFDTDYLDEDKIGRISRPDGSGEDAFIYSDVIEEMEYTIDR